MCTHVTTRLCTQGHHHGHHGGEGGRHSEIHVIGEIEGASRFEKAALFCRWGWRQRLRCSLGGHAAPVLQRVWSCDPLQHQDLPNHRAHHPVANAACLWLTEHAAGGVVHRWQLMYDPTKTWQLIRGSEQVSAPLAPTCRDMQVCMCDCLGVLGACWRLKCQRSPRP